MFAVMMLCNNGTHAIVGTDSSMRWEEGRHVIVATCEPSEDAAYAEARRLVPAGTFNRENARAFVLPWEDRWNPALWPRFAVAYWSR